MLVGGSEARDRRPPVKPLRLRYADDKSLSRTSQCRPPSTSQTGCADTREQPEDPSQIIIVEAVSHGLYERLKLLLLEDLEAARLGDLGRS